MLSFSYLVPDPNYACTPYPRSLWKRNLHANYVSSLQFVWLHSSPHANVCCKHLLLEEVQSELLFILGYRQGTELGYKEVLLLSFAVGVLALGSVLANMDMEMDPQTLDYQAITELLPLGLLVELLKELRIYILSFDRAGYGESDPHPASSEKSKAYDIQEMADQLQLGPKFYVLGMSMEGYPVWSCLKHIPNRLAGAALVVPLVNFWWSGIPPNIAEQAFKKLLFRYRWAFRVAHYAPWLLHWWVTQKWFPALSVLEGRPDMFSHSDLEIIKKLPETPTEGQVLQQGIYESLLRDLMAGFGTWEFNSVDLSNPDPNSKVSFHIWQGCEDKVIPFELNRYMSKQLPWIQYHEVPDAGHLLIYNSTHSAETAESSTTVVDEMIQLRSGSVMADCWLTLKEEYRKMSPGSELLWCMGLQAPSPRT